MDRMLDIEAARVEHQFQALPVMREAMRFASERAVVGEMSATRRALIQTATNHEQNFEVDVHTPEMGHFSCRAHRY